MSFLAKWRDEGVLSSPVFEKLSAFTDLILRWNSQINLTGLRTREEVEEILIGESILDFGSGAGIPGLVWLIYDPTVQLTSLEVRTKKVAFQKEVVRLLPLRAEIVCGHFPEAVSGERFDIIATRAIRFDPKLWDQAAGLLAQGGRFLRFGTTGPPDTGWQSIPISERSVLWIR
jgi:16S rRNA (guanine527-N7)-methyltransferase